MALLPRRRRHSLLAVVQLAVALWLAVDGSHTPVTPPSPQVHWRPQTEPAPTPVCPPEGCTGGGHPSGRQP
uniref:Uncharacterized protein n=1 Tax=Oryza barthii TaxID=65489 RepID=A0A0D3F2E9_9ORYZ